MPRRCSLWSILVAIQMYAKTPIYDCIALAIAKERGLVLLTGDGALRKAAAQEGVEVMGTIDILDQFFEGEYIEGEEYKECIRRLMEKNGGKGRLPQGGAREKIGEIGKG